MSNLLKKYAACVFFDANPLWVISYGGKAVIMWVLYLNLCS
jgi:hypothetical protein